MEGVRKITYERDEKCEIKNPEQQEQKGGRKHKHKNKYNK
jgi:hypothetical protein